MVEKLLANDGRGVAIRLFLIASFSLVIQLIGKALNVHIHTQAITSVLIFMACALVLIIIAHRKLDSNVESFLVSVINLLLNISAVGFLFFNIVTNETTLKSTPLFLVILYSYQQSQIVGKLSILYLALIDSLFVIVVWFSFSSIISNSLSLLFFVISMLFSASTIYLLYERTSEKSNFIEAVGEIISRPKTEKGIMHFWIDTETGPNFIKWKLPKRQFKRGDLVKAIGVNSGEKADNGRHVMFLLAYNVELLES